MAVMLRASLGHLEMRRMNLPRAREELETALRLCGRSGNLSSRVVILNNLGIAANQLNDYARARECFREAERMLLTVLYTAGQNELENYRFVVIQKEGGG